MLGALIAIVFLIQPPKELSGHCGVGVAGNIYTVGGMGLANTGAFYPTLWRVDPERGKWTQLADMRVARAMSGAAFLDGSIYVAGGFTWDGKHTDSVERYDIKTGRWSGIAPLNHSRSRFSLVFLDHRVYAISGMKGEWRGSGELNTTEVEEYDPGSNKWRVVGNLNRARHGYATAAWRNRIYVFGGYAGDMTDSCECWDPKTGRSTNLPSMPVKRGFHSVVIVEGRMICFGGRSASAHPSAFDPQAQRWTDLPVPDIELNRFIEGVIGGRIWMIGGESKSPVPIIQSIDLDTWKLALGSREPLADTVRYLRWNPLFLRP